MPAQKQLQHTIKHIDKVLHTTEVLPAEALPEVTERHHLPQQNRATVQALHPGVAVVTVVQVVVEVAAHLTLAVVAQEAREVPAEAHVQVRHRQEEDKRTLRKI